MVDVLPLANDRREVIVSEMAKLDDFILIAERLVRESQSPATSADVSLVAPSVTPAESTVAFFPDCANNGGQQYAAAARGVGVNTTLPDYVEASIVVAPKSEDCANDIPAFEIAENITPSKREEAAGVLSLEDRGDCAVAAEVLDFSHLDSPHVQGSVSTDSDSEDAEVELVLQNRVSDIGPAAVVADATTKEAIDAATGWLRSQSANQRSFACELGRKLRQRRWMLGLSLRELSDRVGMYPQMIRDYESGIAEIDEATLISIAEVLDVPVTYLLEAPGGSSQLTDPVRTRPSSGGHTQLDRSDSFQEPAVASALRRA